MFRKLPIFPWAAHLKKCINSQRMAATMSADAHNKYQHTPLIVIIGATGCGKTKLSLELARRFSGEMISANSMQIYRGLDISTAKATAEEQAQRLALAAIDDILALQKVPVIVGGTNYYIESIFWDTLVGASNAADRRLVDTDQMNIVEEKDHYRRLEAVWAQRDTAPSADRGEPPSCAGSGLHPHNRRMVIREVLERCTRAPVASKGGVTCSPSSVVDQVDQGTVDRFARARAVLLWLNCKREVLESRLERRVDQMMRGKGLTEELRAFHRQYNSLRLQQNR
ncbi:tRNA dimethylallyltransferase [Tyrophagus putrescentiae]|nr:tRNA dimethylallyltransferase [Tyrophagus putrescentiae]